MFTGYIGSHWLMLSSVLLKEKKIKTITGRGEEGKAGEGACPNDFGFVELPSEGYGLYCI